MYKYNESAIINITKGDITMTNTKRTFTAAFKAKLILEILANKKDSHTVAAENQLEPELLEQWKVEFLANASSVFKSTEENADNESAIEDTSNESPKVAKSNQDTKASTANEGTKAAITNKGTQVSTSNKNTKPAINNQYREEDKDNQEDANSEGIEAATVDESTIHTQNTKDPKEKDLAKQLQEKEQELADYQNQVKKLTRETNWLKRKSIELFGPNYEDIFTPKPTKNK